MEVVADTGRLIVDGQDVAAVEVAESMRARSRGLLGRDGLDGGFLIRPCRQVHTFRMRFALDVAFLGRDGTVLHAVTMPPQRLSRLVWRSRAVLEAQAGSFDRWALAAGSRVGVEST